VTATFAVLVVLLAAATATDLRHRRIPNGLTATGIVVGLALGLVQGQLAASFLGLGAALAIGLPLFALGALGGGDAKLLGAVGALLGPTSFVSALLYAGLAGGAMALVQAVRRGTIIPLLLRTFDLALWAVTLGRRGMRLSLESPGALSIPYGAAIAVGALAAWFFPLLAGGVT
jgi:prepilin peptidase CpaA